jgi:hypothetical protein
MRFTFVILLFCGLGADAQMIIKAHANYRPLAQPVVNLLLDDYPNAAAAYSLRKLRTAYTGNCIRVRRSNDNSEQDIGFSLSGYLDTSALKTFVGAGNNGFITIWYNQMGVSSRDLNNAIAVNQPIIVSSGNLITIDGASNSEKAIAFNQSGHSLVTSFTTIPQPISVFSYARKDNATTAAAGVIYDSYLNTQSILYYTGTAETTNNRWSIAAGAGLQGTTSGNTNPNLFSTLHNGASSSIHINGQSYASGNAGTNGLNGLTIGNLRTGIAVSGYVFNGRIAEIVIYGSNQSSNRTGIENNINTYYSIY